MYYEYCYYYLKCCTFCLEYIQHWTSIYLSQTMKPNQANIKTIKSTTGSEHSQNLKFNVWHSSLSDFSCFLRFSSKKSGFFSNILCKFKFTKWISHKVIICIWASSVGFKTKQKVIFVSAFNVPQMTLFFKLKYFFFQNHFLEENIPPEPIFNLADVAYCFDIL